LEHDKAEKWFVAIFTVCWGLYALAFLSRSLWVDETITYWVANGSFVQTFSRAYNFQGQSPLFFLIENLVLQVSRSEIALRLPSVLFGVASIIGVFLVAEKLFDKSTAFLSALFLVSSGDFIGSLVNARPYSLGIFTAILSIYFLLLWIGSNHSRWLLALAMSLLVMILSHYLFAVMVVVLLFVWFVNRKKNRSLPKLLTALSVCLLPLLFGWFQLQNLNERASLSFDSLSFLETLSSIIQPPLFVLLFLVVLKFRRRFSELTTRVREVASTEFAIVVFWFVFPPILLWALGYVLGSSIYQSRYVVYCVPAYSILGAYLIQSFFVQKGKLAVIVLFQLLCLSIQISDPRVSSEDWRKVASLLQEQRYDEAVPPVLVHSTLMETSNSKWLLEQANAEYVLAPFSYYEIPNDQIPLPMYLSFGADDRYFAEVLRPIVGTQANLYIITRAGRAGIDYLSKVFTELDYSIRVVFESDSVSLMMAEQDSGKVS
jgi:hypothetical protein